MFTGIIEEVGRVKAIGSGVLQLGRCLSVEEVIERYDAVTREDVLRLAREIMTPEKLSFSAVGKLAGAEEYLSLLQ